MRKTVLVVEDNLLNRSLLCQILADEYAVLEAENGQEALALLGQYGEGISLILLDIVMPVMDGYTFLKIIKADPAYAAIPVIVTTQNDAESDEVAALSHGRSLSRPLTRRRRRSYAPRWQTRISRSTPGWTA